MLFYLCPTYSRDRVFLKKICVIVLVSKVGALVHCLFSLFLNISVGSSFN